MKVFSATIVLLILVFGGISAQNDRKVFWSHGLYENGLTWDQMEDIFDIERKISLGDQSPMYTSDDGVSTATSEHVGLMQTLFGSGSNDPSNIGIGHSMGGVVLRNVDATQPVNDRKFGGLITVGSPNDGAAIANSYYNGEVDEAFDHACNALAAGPLSVLPFIPVVINGVAADIMCQALEEEYIKSLLGAIGSNQSAQDLQVGSAVLDNIYNGASGIPLISIWGNEQSPVHWRLLSSFTSGNSNDTDWVNLAEDFRNVYNTQYITHLSTSVVTGILGIFFPPVLSVTAPEAYKAIQWKRGVNWFDHSESMWNSLINCTTGETYTVVTTYEIWVGDAECPGGCDELCIDIVTDACLADPANCWETVTTYHEVEIQGGSDGFICRYSQIIDGTPSGNHYAADFANHVEETVHVEVERRIRDCFERPDFFFTDIR